MEEIVQYYIVNQQLKMSAGKVAAQVAHAATQGVLQYHRQPLFSDWLSSGQTKIILKANQVDLENLVEQGYVSIKDAGRTEIEAGSLTVVCLPPMRKKDAQKLTSKFNLFS